MNERPWPRSYVLSAVACAAAVVSCGGCGGDSSASSSKAPATVHGTVKIKGKLARSGEIEFNPANVNRRDAAPASAKINKDGSYSLITLAGGNNITVTAPEIKKNPSLERPMPFVDVKAGDNAIDIEIPPRDR
jgi:hypothetical protein